MASAPLSTPPSDRDLTAAVLDAWKRGRDTRTIAELLFRGQPGGLGWFEGRICSLIAAEQDRRHAARVAGTATSHTAG